MTAEWRWHTPSCSFPYSSNLLRARAVKSAKARMAVRLFRFMTPVVSVALLQCRRSPRTTGQLLTLSPPTAIGTVTTQLLDYSFIMDYMSNIMQVWLATVKLLSGLVWVCPSLHIWRATAIKTADKFGWNGYDICCLFKLLLTSLLLRIYSSCLKILRCPRCFMGVTFLYTIRFLLQMLGSTIKTVI